MVDRRVLFPALGFDSQGGRQTLENMKKCVFFVYGVINFYPAQGQTVSVNPAILEAAKKPIFESPKGFEIEDTWEDIEF